MLGLRLFARGGRKLPPVLCVRCGYAGVLGRNSAGAHQCGVASGRQASSHNCDRAMLRLRALECAKEYFAQCNGNRGGMLGAAWDDRIDEDMSIGELKKIWRELEDYEKT